MQLEPGQIVGDRYELQERQVQFRDRVSITPGLADWLTNLIQPDVNKRVASAREGLKSLEQSHYRTSLPRKLGHSEAIVGPIRFERSPETAIRVSRSPESLRIDCSWGQGPESSWLLVCILFMLFSFAQGFIDAAFWVVSFGLLVLCV